MEKMMCMRSLYRSVAASSRSLSSIQNHLRHYSYPASRLLFPPHFANPRPTDPSSGRMHPFSMNFGGRRFFSEDVSHLPDIKDPQILQVFKDFMAASWDELPDGLISAAKKALSKSTDDKTGQEILANVFRAAEAVEEFTGILVSLRMELDDTVGMSGENVKPLSKEFKDALKVAHDRYAEYLSSFGPDEVYLRKKVETELGTRLIHLKMRCSGLGSEWGEVTILGTSGLSGSYVEQRGP
uniref:Succinate dehydrogenase subunit 5 n=1 Tax=Kalanchoe fedtschenkoi TaxID=63787 RepID=A0A7N0VIJ9_KALFE